MKIEAPMRLIRTGQSTGNRCSRFIAVHRGMHSGHESAGRIEADLAAIEQVYLRAGGEFLVGFSQRAAGCVWRLQETYGCFSQLRRMRINRELQGKGYGTQLLREWSGWRFSLAFAPLCLDTPADGPLTLKFYHKHGYQETGQGFYGKVETVQFSKTLD